jgi:hypothetical protein
MSDAAHHALEPEFTGGAPRPIPESLRSGAYARRRRAALLGLAAWGAASLVLAQVPQVQRLAVYLLPLAYLEWLGIGCLALAALRAAGGALQPGPYRYVRDGVPIPARVGFIMKSVEAEINGAPASHRFEVAAEIDHPETGEPVELLFRSGGFPSSDRDSYDTPFRRGDVVTAVYLPGEFDKTLRLYPLMELNPAHSLRRAGAPSPALARAKLVGTVLLVMTPFLGSFWGLSYWPLEMPPGPALWAAVAGSLAAGAAYVGGIFWSYRRRLREVAGRNLEALDSGAPLEVSVPVGGSGRLGVAMKCLLVAGAPLIGGVLVVPYFLLANARLDGSPPRLEPVRIEGRSERTHSLVFRQYRLDYAFESEPGDSQHITMSPEELARFEGERGVAVVREGRFGWPWVEGVSPAP